MKRVVKSSNMLCIFSWTCCLSLWWDMYHFCEIWRKAIFKTVVLYVKCRLQCIFACMLSSKAQRLLFLFDLFFFPLIFIAKFDSNEMSVCSLGNMTDKNISHWADQPHVPLPELINRLLWLISVKQAIK